ncbi:MAG: LysR family transcriptional regulator, partial [Cyanobacteria bacterium P01_A01_bin.114]
MGLERSNQLKPAQLQVLLIVADCGSFSEAALQLQLSQSAISYTIASLEEELGVMLFSRGRYGATLTPIGAQIAERARQVLYLV